MDPKTVKDAILSCQKLANIACIEEAAGFVGEIISDQFKTERFWHPLKFEGTDTFISAAQHNIETDGWSIGPWLEAVSKGEDDWDGTYPVNYTALLEKDEIIEYIDYNQNKVKRVQRYNRSDSEAFRAKVAVTPQPLMRDFQADPRNLRTIVLIAISAVCGKAITNIRHRFILLVYWDCMKNNDPDYKPSIAEVWGSIETLADAGHDLIQRIGPKQIWWRGTDQPMSRHRVENLLSNFRKLDENTIQKILREST